MSRWGLSGHGKLARATKERDDDVCRGGRPLRPHAVQEERAPGAEAARDLARPLAELRWRPPARALARDAAPRVRPWRDALRPREQLRAAVRGGREELRLDLHPGLPPLP